MTKKQMEGEGVLDVIKGLNKFLRKHKIISKGASILAPLAGKRAGKVRAVGSVAQAAGFGKGGGLKLAGQGPKKRTGRRPGRPRKK